MHCQVRYSSLCGTDDFVTYTGYFHAFLFAFLFHNMMDNRTCSLSSWIPSGPNTKCEMHTPHSGPPRADHTIQPFPPGPPRALGQATLHTRYWGQKLLITA